VRDWLPKCVGWEVHGVPVVGVVLPCPPASIVGEAVKGKSLSVISAVQILLPFNLI